MSKTIAAEKQNTYQTIGLLVEIAKFDTLYRDIYLQRARELMTTLLPYSTYEATKESAASLGWIETQLRATVERGDWKRAAELTERLRTVKGAVAANSESMRVAEPVYEGLAETPIDPFSSGLHVFVGASKEQLLEWRDRAVGILSRLQRADNVKQGFYARREADLKSLEVKAPGGQTQETKKTSDPSQLRQEALSALESGDLTQLDTLVQKLMEKPAATEEKKEVANTTPEATTELGNDLLYSFSEATLAAAKDLGLAPVRTRSRREFAHFVPLGWEPSFQRDEVKKWSKEQITRLSFPSETGDKAKEAIEFYLLNPFINSGGARYQVCLVVEDLLLEDFPEPEAKQEPANTKLLAALGLTSRWGLSRLEIENALMQHGPRILAEQLKLDPAEFRLVAIPADIYTHLASNYGWGQKEMWTHFDGYRLMGEGKLQALAGGDKRFGGTHDVVSFSRNYTSNKIMARFAVVQRKRMMSWHAK